MPSILAFGKYYIYLFLCNMGKKEKGGMEGEGRAHREAEMLTLVLITRDYCPASLKRASCLCFPRAVTMLAFASLLGIELGSFACF